MATLDITNEYDLQLATVTVLSSSSTFFTSEIDISNSDPGFSLVFFIVDPINGATLNIKLQDNDGSGWVDIPDDKIISESGINSLIIDQDHIAAINLSPMGAFSNSKLVRGAIAVTNFNTDVLLVSILYKKTEQLPPLGS